MFGRAVTADNHHAPSPTDYTCYRATLPDIGGSAEVGLACAVWGDSGGWGCAGSGSATGGVGGACIGDRRSLARPPWLAWAWPLQERCAWSGAWVVVPAAGRSMHRQAGKRWGAVLSSCGFTPRHSNPL